MSSSTASSSRSSRRVLVAEAGDESAIRTDAGPAGTAGPSVTTSAAGPMIEK
jgi:hypothetical protein